MAGSPGCVPDASVGASCVVERSVGLLAVSARVPHVGESPAWQPEVSAVHVQG